MELVVERLVSPEGSLLEKSQQETQQLQETRVGITQFGWRLRASLSDIRTVSADASPECGADPVGGLINVQLSLHLLNFTITTAHQGMWNIGPLEHLRVSLYLS